LGDARRRATRAAAELGWSVVESETIGGAAGNALKAA
jgi:hypothetical protein